MLTECDISVTTIGSQLCLHSNFSNSRDKAHKKISEINVPGACAQVTCKCVNKILIRYIC